MGSLLNRNSLLARLLLRIFGISIVAIIVTFAVINTQMDKSLDVLRDQTVEEQAQTIQSYLKAAKAENKVVLSLPDHIRIFYANAGPAYQYLVRDAGGQILFRSAFAYSSYFPSNLKSIGDGKFQFKGPAGYDYVGFTLKQLLEKKEYYIQVAQTKQAANIVSGQISDSFMKRILWLGVPFYTALLWIILTTLRRGFEPLYRASKEVSKLTITNPDFQIAENGVPDEILPFIRAINFSFHRLGKSIREQKELTENLAHELRTPLSVLKAHIEMLGKNKQAEKLGQDVDNMIKLVNQMLDMTRLEYADTIEMKEIDLGALVSQVCQDLWPLFLKSNRELRVSGVDREVVVMGDKDMVYRAVRNVLDNALEHSPAKTPVEVSVRGTAVEVRDYGSPIPESMRHKIFDRFLRDDGKKRGDKSGAGLGLSIVRRTMEVHSGSVSLDRAPDEGNIFRLEFPGIPFAAKIRHL